MKLNIVEDEIEIKGQLYRIEYVDKPFEFKGTLADATVDNNEKLITINRNAKDVDRLIRHELIHAYFDECNLPCYSNDEVLVNWLAYGIPEIEYSVATLINGLKEE